VCSETKLEGKDPIVIGNSFHIFKNTPKNIVLFFQERDFVRDRVWEGN
jgi:hypothetical protein